MARIRPLTSLERNIYTNALSTATLIAPVFVTALNNLRPAVDEDCPTAYVDPWSRVALSSYFFAETTPVNERVSMLLHESLHVLNNHFIRAKNAEHSNQKLSNIAGDMEINSLLLLMKQSEGVKLRMDNWVFPGNHKPPLRERLSMEEYYMYMETNLQGKQQRPGEGNSGSGSPQDGDSGGSAGSQGDTSSTNNGGSSVDSSGTGTGQDGGYPDFTEGNPCSGVDTSTGTENGFDEAGIEKSSTEEMVNAVRDVEYRAREAARRQAAKSIGAGAGENFYDVLLDRLSPPKVNWRSMLRNILSQNRGEQRRGNRFRTYARPARWAAGLPDKSMCFPSRFTYPPSVMVGIDTSGSMGDEDNQAFLSELKSLLSKFGGREGVPLFSVDTVVHNKPTMVKRLEDIRLYGGGGTDMAPAFTYIRSLETHRKPGGGTQAPGLFVLATDGYVPWEPVLEELRKPHEYKSIILVTDSGGYRGAPVEELEKYAMVVDVGVKDSDYDG